MKLNTYNCVEDRDSVPDLSIMNAMMTRRSKVEEQSLVNSAVGRIIAHAPLLSGHLVVQHTKDLSPQYGFPGCLSDEDLHSAKSKVFQNTNVPFSTFVCGAQGSGKSHTTACFLENALIPSKQLGRLETPASALVFSYGKWSSSGSGFNISEAAYLSASKTTVPDHRVERVTVLVSPSNLAIQARYQKLPNVHVISFKLNSKTLDIVALRTLMGVDEENVPLYMAKVESLVRNIASQSKDGCLDYKTSKERLSKEYFDDKQKNMLEMRLNLLESFIDSKGSAVVPDYRPGELTIIDLTDPFATPNTACILFKLGLDQFLQSSATSKMIVLDEAHKVNPAPVECNAQLTTMPVHARHSWLQVPHRPPDLESHPLTTPRRRTSDYLDPRTYCLNRSDRALFSNDNPSFH